MAEERNDVEVDEEKKKEPAKKSRGMISRIWNGIFRLSGDDFEKRLQYISKEEANVLKRINERSLKGRRRLHQILIFFVTLEVIAVSYAIIATRTMDLDWKMRVFKILPMFILPVLLSAIYYIIRNVNKILERKDQKILEKLRAERQAKIDELKEKTNYYTTQQLIQRYDPDPAAKAAAATVLASKLGADSGLKVYVADQYERTTVSEMSNNVEQSPHIGLRNRRQAKNEHGISSASPLADEMYMKEDGENRNPDRLVVEHQDPNVSQMNDGGWIARLAAFLVGEDPMTCYALICGHCHMHNGLVRKEDYPFVTYYCPHCQALNQPKHLSPPPSASASDGPADMNPVNLVNEESEEIVETETKSEETAE